MFRRVAAGKLLLIITPVVMAELVYVAAGPLRWARSQTSERLTALLDAEGVITPERSTLQRALALFRVHRRLDFADAYLAAVALEAGPPVVASFDGDLGRIEGLRRVDA